MTRYAIALSAILLSSPAIASFETSQLALKLGSVLASEEACGLKYNQAAIKHWIETNVDAGDMDFPSALNAMTAGSKYNLESMSKSTMTAYCTQVRRLAKEYGFVQ